MVLFWGVKFRPIVAGTVRMGKKENKAEGGLRLTGVEKRRHWPTATGANKAAAAERAASILG